MIDARDLLPDFLYGFKAYFSEDIRFIASLGAQKVEHDPSLIFDFFGMRIDPDYEPVQKARRGEVIKSVPFPTDTILSEGIEYAALAQSLIHSDQSFDLIELGAGWGPWVSRAVICARRLHKKRIVIRAVEADSARFHALRRHLALNEIIPLSERDEGTADDLVWHLHNAIIWTDDEGASWPRGELVEAGRHATRFRKNLLSNLRDWRNRKKFIPMKSISLTKILRDHRKVDLLHIDVQGTEAALISSALDDLNERVRYLFVGTHSRLIEGQILTTFLKEGWALLREEPCLLRAGTGNGILQEMTIRDGGQLWVNPRLVPNCLASAPMGRNWRFE